MIGICAEIAPTALMTRQTRVFRRRGMNATTNRSPVASEKTPDVVVTAPVSWLASAGLNALMDPGSGSPRGGGAGRGFSSRSAILERDNACQVADDVDELGVPRDDHLGILLK